MLLGLKSFCVLTLLAAYGLHAAPEPKSHLQGLGKYVAGDATTFEKTGIDTILLTGPAGSLTIPKGRLSKRRVLLNGVSLEQVSAVLHANLKKSAGWVFRNFGMLDSVSVLKDGPICNREAILAFQDPTALHQKHLHMKNPSKETDVPILIWDIEWLGR